MTNPSVSEALASANHSADVVQQSLLGNGVAKKDLQTSGESVSAKLRDLGRAGDAIGKAVGAGGNAVRVNAISLDLEDTGALVSAARGKAFAEARAKAEQYARAAGRTLGDVVSIAEDVSTASRTHVPFAAAAGSPLDKASVPIQPGSQDVSVSVTVVFTMR